MDNNRLSEDDYYLATKLSPILAIDLIVQDQDGCILVGRRRNAPARGAWFVPGGALRKGETVREGIQRVCLEELGFTIDPRLLIITAIADHVYPDNFRDDQHGTQYVCLAYSTAIADRNQVSSQVFAKQHLQMAWMTKENIRKYAHPNTTNYFKNASDEDISFNLLY